MTDAQWVALPALYWMCALVTYIIWRALHDDF